MRLRSKLFLVNTLVLVLLLGSLSILLEQRGSAAIFDKVSANAELSVLQTAENLDNWLVSYERIVDHLFVNSLLQEKMLTPYSDFADAQDVYSAYFEPYFKAFNTANNMVSLNLYSDNPTFQFADIRYLGDGAESEIWHRQNRTGASGKHWTSVYWNREYGVPVISLWQQLNNLAPDNELYAVIDVSAQELYRLVEKESATKRYFIVLPGGSLWLDSANRTGAFGNLRDYSFYPQLPKGDGKAIIDGEAGRMLAISHTLTSRSSVQGIRVIALMPIKDLTQNADEIQSLAFTLLILFSLISALLIYLLSFGLTKRLTLLSDRIKRVDARDLPPEVKVRGSDEVAQLAIAFNSLIGRLNRMIEEEYKAEIRHKELALRAAQAELNALQAQINPHYLFNTLNMLRGNLLEAGDHSNAHIVSLLARSFRIMLRGNRKLVELKDEMENIDTYLQIQTLRFSDRLSFHLDIPKEAEGCLIPWLTLQPIVENAIIHGIERKKGHSLISISADVRDGKLTIVVEDNGLGMPVERLRQVRSDLRDGRECTGSGSHIGLPNVHLRLERYFGSGYGLQIDSKQGAWTRVIILIPYNLEERDIHVP